MLFKMKFVACMLALSIAGYAQAQEKAAGQTGTPQNPSATSQAAKTQSDRQTTTGENQNRRQDQAGQSTNNQNRSTDAQNRDAQNRSSTTTDTTNQNREGRTTGRDVNVQRTETRETHAVSSDKPLDSHLASCLLLGNKKEVAISQWAADRAKNEKVKEFARQMVKDHGQAITMLQRFASADASKDFSSSSSSTINRSETVNRSTTTTDSNRDSNRDNNRDNNAANRNPNDATNPSRSADRENPSKSADVTSQANRNANEAPDRNRSVTSVQVRSEHEAIPDKMFAIQREVSEKCLAMAKQELEQSSNFDQAYVGMQISEHIGMIAKLETYKSYASQDLGKVIQESLDTAQNHLRHAKELVMQISHDSAAGRTSPSGEANRKDASSRTESSTRTESSDRDANTRTREKRDEAGTRRDDASKKDAPKS